MHQVSKIFQLHDPLIKGEDNQPVNQTLSEGNDLHDNLKSGEK